MRRGRERRGRRRRKSPPISLSPPKIGHSKSCFILMPEKRIFALRKRAKREFEEEGGNERMGKEVLAERLLLPPFERGLSRVFLLQCRYKRVYIVSRRAILLQKPEICNKSPLFLLQSPKMIALYNTLRPFLLHFRASSSAGNIIRRTMESSF